MTKAPDHQVAGRRINHNFAAGCSEERAGCPGGAVSDLLRNDLRETFGAEVLEFYSSKECGAIAVRCLFGHGYHVNPEMVLMEVVDAQGRPVRPARQAGP